MIQMVANIENEQLRVIEQYIQDEFPDSELKQIPNRDPSRAMFEVLHQSSRFLLSFDEGFLNETPDHAIYEKLSECRVAGVMRDVGEFEVLVTPSGCIFA